MLPATKTIMPGRVHNHNIIILTHIHVHVRTWYLLSYVLHTIVVGENLLFRIY